MSAQQILAKNMRSARQEMGLSQEEFADRAGIDRTYVSSIERAKYAVSVKMLDKLAAVLGVEAWELLKPR